MTRGSSGSPACRAGDTLPLAPGETLTLAIGDAYYRPDLSHFSGVIAAGTEVYAQVDSANTETDYGGVLEGHEAADKAYNNIVGPVTPAASVAIDTERLTPNEEEGSGAGLPPRPE